MSLHRLAFRLRPTVTHVRSLHSSGYVQQQEAVAVEPEPESLSVFRTQEKDPACHSDKHVGQFYTLSSAHVRPLFPDSLPWRYQQQMKTFNEACIMVRQPALEVISYLKKADYSQPALRYVLYGLKGTGKTMSLCHTLHFCYTQGWLVLHVPDAHLWVKNCKELLPSSYKSSRFDQPLQATTWLRNFKITNEPFLSKIKLKERYVWTKRESTEAGSSLGELVDQGISRIKSSSDVVGAVMKELRLQSGQPRADFRLAVAVDGVNALWGRSTIKTGDKTAVDPEELTLVYNLRKLMKNDWVRRDTTVKASKCRFRNLLLTFPVLSQSGGAVITTLSQTGSLYSPKSAHLPQDLLGERGFDSMDPFIPVSVPNYSEKEFESCYLYYMDRNWLQHPQSRTEEGKKELIFLCNMNPSMFERLCGHL